MMRGTFANIRLRNEIAGKELIGGLTVKFPEGDEKPIYDASLKYIEDNVPLLVLAGKEYGSGASRDWAAKGTNLLGVKAGDVEFTAKVRIDTPKEREYFKHGGILQFVLRQLMAPTG
jgi:aconitase A